MILKIDTTDTNKISVGILEKNKKVDKIVENRKTSSQILLASILNILKKNKLDLSEVKGMIVNTGPGSFTGTRVGVAVANALGFALNIPVNSKRGKITLPKYTKSKFD